MDAVRRNMQRFAKDSGMRREGVSPHSWRKVYAVNLFRETGDLGAVQRSLNHRYESTTMAYAFADKLSKPHKKA